MKLGQPLNVKLLIVSYLLTMCCAGWLRADESEIRKLEFFESEVRPLLVSHCYSCHSDEAALAGKLKGGLRLDTRAGVQTGGDSGLIIKPGHPEESLLIKSVRYSDENLQMPPSQRLSPEQVASLEKWVAWGAPDPRESTAASSLSGKRVIDLDAERNQWAFQSPIRHAAPNVADSSWPKQQLDYFVLAAIEQRNLQPVQPATRREWIRRATFDLIGLPPTPPECEAFERDTEPEAYERVVNRLLDSAHYGERWGRYWLDVARYADDQGNSFLTPTPEAYLYRDWVVQALNRDLPYDEFLRLQIAGDEVLDPTSDYVTRLAGLGFQSLGPQFRKGAAGEAKAKADELEDRVDTLTRGILGLTVSCARCHDHKFDPIPTSDYYSLAAAYNGVEWPSRMLAAPEVVETHRQWTEQVDAQTKGLKKWREDQARLLGRQALEKVNTYLIAASKVSVLRSQKLPLDEAAFAQQEGLNQYFLNRWVKVLDEPGDEPILKTLRDAAQQARNTATVSISDAMRQQIDEFTNNLLAALAVLQAKEQPATDPSQTPTPLSASQERLLTVVWKDAQAPFFVADSDLLSLLSDLQKQHLAELQRQLDTLMQTPPAAGPKMPSIRGGGQPMQVFIRGNPTQLGEQAPPGFLRVLCQTNAQPAGETFTRLALANAIVNRHNPLTARVIVNRVWHYHFGRGIVATLSNFGKLGSPPTHPELLDALAVRFMDSGWSLKWLHREIMLSATYQLASSQNTLNMTIDPGNEYLWRMTPRRLDFEAWRDAMLSVAGKLDRQLGGPSVDQLAPGLKEVEGFNFFTRLNGFEADDPAGTRRTLYSVVSRYAPNTTLTLFDFPEPNVTSDQRTATTVPQQQLFVLNSPFILELSREFSKRLEKAAIIDEDRIQFGWQLAYGRLPTPEEIGVAREFLHTAAETATTNQLTPWEQLAHALLASNEFAFLP